MPQGGSGRRGSRSGQGETITRVNSATLSELYVGAEFAHRFAGFVRPQAVG